jgi:arsenate reductase
MDATIFHNPACGTSRNTLALLRHAGIEPTVIAYLETPPSRATIVDLAARIGVSLRDLLREKGTPFAELGLADPGLADERLLDAIEAHPILLNRPIVVTPAGAKLCRPSDMVLDLLPDVPLADFVKDDGEPALRDREIGGDDPGLRAALNAADLPTDDLAEPGRRFFAYTTLSGRTVGHAGFELYGEDVFLRSLVVLPEARGHGHGAAIVARVCRRAWDLGGRRAWTLTTTVADWLVAKGFQKVERSAAPASILATRQAKSLCPSTAILLSRPIRL